MSQTTNLSRRAFVAGLSATSVYAADQIMRASEISRGAPHRLDLATVTPETFATHQGTSFYFQHGWLDSLQVELVAVDKRRRLGKKYPATRAPFSLLFRGPGDLRLPQETYAVGHDQLGRFEIFVTPVGPRRQDKVMYEAVFG